MGALVVAGSCLMKQFKKNNNVFCWCAGGKNKYFIIIIFLTLAVCCICMRTRQGKTVKTLVNSGHVLAYIPCLIFQRTLSHSKNYLLNFKSLNITQILHNIHIDPIQFRPPLYNSNSPSCSSSRHF